MTHFQKGAGLGPLGPLLISASSKQMKKKSEMFIKDSLRKPELSTGPFCMGVPLLQMSWGWGVPIFTCKFFYCIFGQLSCEQKFGDKGFPPKCPHFFFTKQRVVVNVTIGSALYHQKGSRVYYRSLLREKRSGLQRVPMRVVVRMQLLVNAMSQQFGPAA